MYQPGVTLEDIERETILEAVRYWHGNRVKTAEALEISPRTLHSRLVRYGEQGHAVPPAPAPFGRDAEEQAS